MREKLIATYVILIFILPVGFYSCDDIFPSVSGPVNIGWVPVYESSDSLFTFSRKNRRDAKLNDLLFYDPVDSTQFIVIDAFRYRIDTLRGIILQDTSADLLSTFADHFYSLPGVRSMRLESDSLFVNNLSDELTLSTADAPVLSVSSRRPEAFDPFVFPEQKPDPSSLGLSNQGRYSYFECPDSLKGVLLGWRLEFTSTASCYVFQ